MQNSSFYNTIGTSPIGNIHLLTLGNVKDVKVRYTTDDWQTYTDVNADYDYDIYSMYDNGHEIENWEFSINIPQSGLTIKCAISYTVKTVTYWDKNFTENYSFS